METTERKRIFIASSSGLTYACQTEDFYCRAARRSRKLFTRLGDEIGPPWMPLKPKGMRWATYLRYINQIKALESVADRRLLMMSVRSKASGFV